MEDKTKLVKEIISKFPNFVMSNFYHPDVVDLPYVFVGDFGDYLIDQVNNSNDQEIKSTIKFIGENYNIGSLDEQDQIWIGIFEVCGGNAKCIKLLEEQLSGQARDDFQKFLSRTI